jgi:hypothetical protein
MTRNRARRTSLKGKQLFHGQVYYNSRPFHSFEPTGELVEFNGATYYKKTPAKVFSKVGWPDYSGFMARKLRIARGNSSINERMTLGESIVLRGIWRIYNRLNKKGTFKKRNYFLRPLRIFRVNNDQFIAEFLDKPNLYNLRRYILLGESAVRNDLVEQCSRFIKENGLKHYLESQKSRKELAGMLVEGAGQAATDLAVAGKKFKENAIKRKLNSNFEFDFFDSLGVISVKGFEKLSRVAVERNLIVESFKDKTPCFVLIDPLCPSESENELPSISRTEKRNKRIEVKRKRRTYSTEGHSKRRKK